MAHHHHHHRREEEQQEEGFGYGSDPAYSAPPPVDSPYSDPPADAYGRPQQGSYDPPTTVKYEQEQVYYEPLKDPTDYKHERKEEKRHEHLGEAAALAGGAFALYERHEMKVDPENARRHKIEEEIAETTAVGGAGYTVYEHHEIKKTERQEEEAEGKHHHRWL